MFTLVYLCLPLFTRVYLCLLVFSYFYLDYSSMFTYVVPCLLVFTHVYSIYPRFLVFTYGFPLYSCVPIFTSVNSCTFTYVYPHLFIFTYFDTCLNMCPSKRKLTLRYNSPNWDNVQKQPKTIFWRKNLFQNWIIQVNTYLLIPRL